MGKSITRKCWNEKKRAGAKKDRGQRRRGEILRSEVCLLRSSCNFWGKPRAAPDRPTISWARASGQPALGLPSLLALVHVVLQSHIFRNDEALRVCQKYDHAFLNLPQDSRGERESPFPSIPRKESLWFPFPNYGNEFFPSLPVPEIRECSFLIPFPFPNFGNRFFHSLQIPEFWEWLFLIPFPFPNFGNVFFPFPSRSRISGMELSIPVPVPKRPKVIPAHPCAGITPFGFNSL